MENNTADYGRLLARVAITGDSHLSVKDYGQHNNYKEESLHYLRKTGETARSMGATHLIYTGDLSYGIFSDLEYRLRVENEFKLQSESMNGNLWFIKGNHDKASYGMTEYEFYAENGIFRTSETLKIGDTQFVMVDYGRENETPVDVAQAKKTYIIGHNWFGFKDMNLPGKHIELDNMHNWYGIDGIFSGHIHLETMNKGHIFNGDPMNPLGKEVFVWQLPCFARPQFVQGMDETTSGLAVIDIYEKHIQIKRVEVELLPMEESFNMALIAQHKEEMSMSENKYDFAQLMQDIRDRMAQSNVRIDDILANLTGYTKGSANPEDIIMGMEEADMKARLKAVELLKQVTNVKK